MLVIRLIVNCFNNTFFSLFFPTNILQLFGCLLPAFNLKERALTPLKALPMASARMGLLLSTSRSNITVSSFCWTFSSPKALKNGFLICGMSCNNDPSIFFNELLE